MKRSNEKAIWRRQMPESYSPKTGWVTKTVESEVRVMVRAEGYAMVRHKGAMPFAVPEKELVTKVST